MDARVLVTAAGSIVAQGIIKSLRLTSEKGSMKYTIIAADMSPLAAGLYRCDSGILIPPVSSPDYVESIIRICNDNEVQAVFCGSDDELLALAGARVAIEKTGAKMLIAPLQSLATARDKWATYEFCRASGFPCAPSCLPDKRDELSKEFGFPIIVKPREGYGSLHVYIVNSKVEMDNAISAIEKTGWRPLLQKYVTGDEFTTGITIDKNCKYVMSSISIKKTVKHGQTYKAFIDDYHDVRKSAESVALKLGASGPVNVQAKFDGDLPVVFEINPRFSATCPMRAAAGVNEPDIVFRNTVLGEEIKVDSYERLVCMRYWNEVYLPFSLYEKALNSGKIEKGSFVPNYF